jgi:eukaryotic-like serine/threonine-protein kinase
MKGTDMNKHFPLSLVLFVAILAGCAQVNSNVASVPELGSTFVSPKDGMTMVYVPAGDFLMGSEKGLTDEQPQHEVYLDAYWIDQTEVTNAMYRECIRKGKCEPPYSTAQFDDPELADHPVVFVSWVKAKNYCEWVGRRLSTEAEWEKAAIWDPVANQQRVYPWGNEYDCTMGNFDDELELDASIMPNTPEGCDGFLRTAPVGSFPDGASPYGALDMGGNVWEWVHDAFLEVDPLTTTVTNYYAISPRENPQGVDPSLTDYRVVRGGSWSMLFGFGRGAYRLWYGLDDAYEDIGFRCALSASP